jgi:lipid-binding SYLF domain-containing protein
MRTAIGSIALTALFLISSGCSTAPKTQEQKKSLVAEADAALTSMEARDPSLRDLVDRAPGYVMFPDVGTAGAGIGGAYGRGIVYERGRPVGFAELNQGSIGLQLGAESYSELIVFENDAALNRLKSGDFDVGAEAHAVALKAGAGKAATFQGGAAVFQHTRGGLMAAAAINGQKLNYQPMDQSIMNTTGTAGDRPTSKPSAEMQLRTDSGTTSGSVSTDAQTATEKTEQRIEQRRDTAQDPATTSQPK